MNASALIESVQYSVPYTKSKATIQPANVQTCSAYKEQLGPVNNDNTLTLFPIASITPTEICPDNTYKETIIPTRAVESSSNNSCPKSEISITNTATEVCSQVNYKVQLKRINCNTML